MHEAGFIVLAAGLVFGVAETAYFGWNRTAKSLAEKACDAISMLACAAGALAVLLTH